MRGPLQPRPLVAVPNVTAHPSTATVLITVLLYNGPLLCGFDVPIKGSIAVELGEYSPLWSDNIFSQSALIRYDRTQLLYGLTHLGVGLYNIHSLHSYFTVNCQHNPPQN